MVRAIVGSLSLSLLLSLWLALALALAITLTLALALFLAHILTFSLLHLFATILCGCDRQVLPVVNDAVCPRCDLRSPILEVNCQIFRCGWVGDQHLTNEALNKLRAAGAFVGGCLQPFRYDGVTTISCSDNLPSQWCRIAPFDPVPYSTSGTLSFSLQLFLSLPPGQPLNLSTESR